VACLAQNGDGLRADQAGATDATIFIANLLVRRSEMFRSGTHRSASLVVGR